MVILITVPVLAIVAAMAVQPEAPAPASAIGTARTFLEALASDPVAAGALATPDAMMSIFDTGAPLSVFIKEVRPTISWWSTCRITSLAPMAKSGGADKDDKGRLPWLRGGSLEYVTGTYECMTPAGRRIVRIGVTMKAKRVAMLNLSSGE